MLFLWLSVTPISFVHKCHAYFYHSFSQFQRNVAVFRTIIRTVSQHLSRTSGTWTRRQMDFRGRSQLWMWTMWWSRRIWWPGQCASCYFMDQRYCIEELMKYSVQENDLYVHGQNKNHCVRWISFCVLLQSIDYSSWNLMLYTLHWVFKIFPTLIYKF